MHAASRIGHAPLLPEIDVPPGSWAPQRPRGAVALVIMSGLLTTQDELLGPADRLVPWTRHARWTACTALRLAVLGREAVASLRPWPSLAGRIAARRAPPILLPGDDGDADILNLLWRIAQRWGTIGDDAIVLPLDLDGRLLACLCAASDDHIAGSLARLIASGRLATPDGAGWRLLGREDIRARVAHGLAFARSTAATFAAVTAIDVSGVTAMRPIR